MAIRKAEVIKVVLFVSLELVLLGRAKPRMTIACHRYIDTTLNDN